MSDFNEYSIQVGAILDSSSLGRIKTEIRNVTSQIKPIEVSAQIDSKILSQSLLKIRADIEDAFDAARREGKGVEDEFQILTNYINRINKAAVQFASLDLSKDKQQMAGLSSLLS